MAEMIEVENVNTPGRTARVNAAKYTDMLAAFEKALPRSSPGFTQSEMRDAVKLLRWHWKQVREAQS